MSRDDHYSAEEAFHAKDRKQFRKERKIAEARDRSKYKKSDQDQLKKQPIEVPKEHLKRGRVLAISPEGMLVDSEKHVYKCVLKGLLKKDKTRLKNLVAVGDFVHFEETRENEGVVSFIEERSSILSRADNLSRRKEQLIAVNIDQVLIVTSVVLPPLKPFLIDRYIIAARKGNMEPIIIVNKIDLLASPPEIVDAAVLEEDKRLFEEFKAAYSSLGIPFYCVSSKTGEGLEDVKKIMQGKTSVFSGQSGVGKSSLINALLGTELNVGDLAAKTFKGAHTTSTAHLVPLTCGGFCIDTPGIRSFGVWELEAREVQEYFPDILQYAAKCRFPDCKHGQEPGCAVKQAVEEEKISPLRFASYSALMASLEEDHQKR